MAWRAFTLLAALLLACSACSAEQMPLTPPLKTKVKVAVAGERRWEALQVVAATAVGGASLQAWLHCIPSNN